MCKDMEEIEVKFLNINPKEVGDELLRLGANKLFDRLYKIKIFDYPDLRLNGEASWLRLRDEGDKITLSYKQRIGIKSVGGETNDDGMKEIEIVVDSFDKTAELIYALGLVDKFYEEKRRVRYVLDDIEFDIDYMPELAPFLEIESDSWEKIDKAIELLGLDPKEKKIFSAFQIYALRGINMLDYSEFRFSGSVKKI